MFYLYLINILLAIDICYLASRFNGYAYDLSAAAVIIGACVGKFDSASPLWFLTGLIVSSFTRFVYGYCFHAIPSIPWEILHEQYHQQIIIRKRTREFFTADHAIEAVLFLAELMLYCWLFGTTFTLGAAIERYIGQRLRLYVRYGTCCNLFMRNAEAYYFYHLLVDPLQCLGFSAPFWDTLFGTNPFRSRCYIPLPFVEFLFVDYSRERAKMLIPLACTRK